MCSLYTLLEKFYLFHYTNIHQMLDSKKVLTYEHNLKKKKKRESIRDYFLAYCSCSQTDMHQNSLYKCSSPGPTPRNSDLNGQTVVV